MTRETASVAFRAALNQLNEAREASRIGDGCFDCRVWEAAVAEYYVQLRYIASQLTGDALREYLQQVKL